MDYAHFAELVRTRFGPALERLTPEGVREFVAEVRESLFPSKRDGERFVLDDTNVAESIEDSGRSYLDEILGEDPDRAAISLWLHSAEMWYGLVESSYDSRFADLMDDVEGLGGDE